MTSGSAHSGAETNYRAAETADLPGAFGGLDDGCTLASRGPRLAGMHSPSPHPPIQPRLGSF